VRRRRGEHVDAAPVIKIKTKARSEDYIFTPVTLRLQRRRRGEAEMKACVDVGLVLFSTDNEEAILMGMHPRL
jgi:hypothetical protein